MTYTPIRAVAFDMGGTLEDIYYDGDTRREAAAGLLRLMQARDLDPGIPLERLLQVVQDGMAAYQRWREQTEVELPAEQVWRDYVFANGCCPPARGEQWLQRLSATAEELAQFYEGRFHRRRLRPEVPGMLGTLGRRGLGLAVISNIISRGLVARNLAAYGISQHFRAVVTSAGFGRRKPHPAIFLEAARLLGLEPAACAYVGDTISRDVAGARRAGYGLAIQIPSFLTDKADRGDESARPDAVVTDLEQVVELVAAPESQGGAAAGQGPRQ